MKYDISYGDSRRVRMQFSPPWESGGGKVIFRVEYGADEIVDYLLSVIGIITRPPVHQGNGKYSWKIKFTRTFKTARRWLRLLEGRGFLIVQVKHGKGGNS